MHAKDDTANDNNEILMMTTTATTKSTYIYTKFLVSSQELIVQSEPISFQNRATRQSAHNTQNSK